MIYCVERSQDVQRSAQRSRVRILKLVLVLSQHERDPLRYKRKRNVIVIMIQTPQTLHPFLFPSTSRSRHQISPSRLHTVLCGVWLGGCEPGARMLSDLFQPISFPLPLVPICHRCHAMVLRKVTHLHPWKKKKRPHQ